MWDCFRCRKFSLLRAFFSWSRSAPSMDFRAASPEIQRFDSRIFFTASRLWEKVLRLKYPTVNEGRKMAKRKIKMIFLGANPMRENIFILDPGIQLEV